MSISSNEVLRPLSSSFCLLPPITSGGKLKGNDKLPATMTLTLGGVSFTHEISGEIELG